MCIYYTVHYICYTYYTYTKYFVLCSKVTGMYFASPDPKLPRRLLERRAAARHGRADLIEDV